MQVSVFTQGEGFAQARAIIARIHDLTAMPAGAVRSHFLDSIMNGHGLRTGKNSKRRLMCLFNTSLIDTTSKSLLPSSGRVALLPNDVSYLLLSQSLPTFLLLGTVRVG